jgi:hypothetical protein
MEVTVTTGVVGGGTAVVAVKGLDAVGKLLAFRALTITVKELLLASPVKTAVLAPTFTVGAGFAAAPLTVKE